MCVAVRGNVAASLLGRAAAAVSVRAQRVCAGAFGRRQEREGHLGCG